MVPLTMLVYNGRADAASWINLVLGVSFLYQRNKVKRPAYLIVSLGVTATIASTTPAAKPDSILPVVDNLPCRLDH